jgi:hypothetical protein
MPESLSFDIAYQYPDSRSGITIPVGLSYGGLSYKSIGKADTGTAYCLFSNEIATELGIPVEQGLYEVFDTPAGTIEALGHEVTLETFGLSVTSFVYFARYPGLRRNLLGRIGWLRNLRMGLVDYDSMIYFSTY